MYVPHITSRILHLDTRSVVVSFTLEPSYSLFPTARLAVMEKRRILVMLPTCTRPWSHFNDILLIIFICCLFNDVVAMPDNIASNGRMSNE